MKKSEQINKLEEYTEELWNDLATTKNCLVRSKELGLDEEAKLFEGLADCARSRWATAKHILEFLKGESEEI